MYFLDLGHWDLDFYYYNTMLIGCKHLYKCMCFFQHNKGQYSIINSRGIYASAHYWFLCHWILPHYLAMRSGNWVWVENGQTSPLWVEVSGAVLCSNTFLFAHLCAQQSTSTSTLSPTCHIICCIFMLTGLRCLVAMLYFGECVVVDYILLYEMQMRKNMVIQDFILGQRSNLIRLTAVNRLLLSYSFPPWCFHL